ncbi:aspartate aminotransferase family protein [Brevundimonas sp. TWP2-3-4b1]|uniref:aspartate aminotransferase family protein n=1 Tax=Brevundimonas sp. TWP2-3-4b1 TaxID=2804580 RepID=UPI003CF179DE
MTSNRPGALDSFWMPFTANKAYKSDPRLLASAEGMHYYTPEGRPILDGTSGLWCVNAGHGRQPIIDAICQQAATLDFAPTFRLGHPKAFELATRLVEVLPDGIDKVFFVGSGSEAVDTSLKIAQAYHRARGQTERTRFIGRQRGYHGVGFGGISVGGLDANKAGFTLLPGVDHLSHTHSFEHAAFSRGQPTWGAHLADELEDLIALRGAETIAAVIVEPLAGSTGVLVPPIGYLERLRAITAREGILLIFDEVITGFGRLGAATAAERFNVIPDMIVCAKGLTNGAVPMGAVGVSADIYDTVVEGGGEGIEFFHGYTYSGHPLAAAAGIATLDIYRDENLFARAQTLSPIWEEQVHGLGNAANVVDIRNLGLVAAIELAPRPDAPGARGTEVFHRCFDQGVLVRVTGDTIALSPPLIVTESDIEHILGCVSETIQQAA